MKQKIIKAGNSLVVVIPSQFAKNMGLKKGDLVRVKGNISKGQVSYFFTGAQQLSLTS